ncbi:MAG: FAD-dependent oxidoreductase [Ruminococcus sp.]|nr:FAD-dependent oxidoreductase [Ruminococcus sp.]
MYDIIIIGSGPAGLSAALYACRAGLRPIVIEKNYRGTGQIAYSERVDNYLGLPGTNGYELGERFREHAERFGAEFCEEEACGISRDGALFKVRLSGGGSLSGRSIICACGTTNRKLTIPGGELPGVSYCASCDGAFLKGKTAAVIGGGDTALGEAVYLSKIAKKVYLIHRREELRANKSLQQRVKSIPNIQLLLNAVPVRVVGTSHVEAIEIEQSGKRKTLPADGIFAAIGSLPNTKLLEGICALDSNGYVIAGEDGVTSAEGIFAAGDIRTKAFRQVATAAADGANCVYSAEKFLER